MADLTIESMFSPRSYEARMVLSTALMSAMDRKRMLTHGVAAVTQEILQQPNANPAGLTVTVTEVATQPDMQSDLLILATCPQFEMAESSIV